MFRKKPLVSAIGAASLLATAVAVPAQAQQDGSQVEEVVVTGTRLRTSNVTSVSPIVQVDYEEISSRGIARIEDMVNILPSVFVAQTANTANGATGISTLNLRGLGSTRTLVLIDGKRLPFGSSISAAANVDMVPSRLVERVDVLTSGASAVYGSDAVAGVVNFVTRRNFEGFELDYQYGWRENPNGNGFMAEVLARSGIDNPGPVTAGQSGFLSMLMGVNTADGAGNVTLFASYEDQEELLGADRDTGACSLGGTDVISCLGSSNFRRFQGTAGHRVPGIPSRLFQQLDGTLIPFTGAPDQTYNFGARNHYQRPIERWNLGASGHYEISGEMEAYFDTGFMSNVTTSQIAESASFGRPFLTNCDNPLLQAGRGPDGAGQISFADFTGYIDRSVSPAQFTSCNELLAMTPEMRESMFGFAAGVIPDVQFINSHRNVEGGPRISTYENSAFRAVGGLRGDITDDFSFDVFIQYSGNEGTSISQRDLHVDRVQHALFIVEDADGNLVCRDVDARSSGCVPWNIFERNADGTSLVTSEQANYIQAVGIGTGETSQWVIGGTIEGDFTNFGVQLPWADDGLSGLIGFETRTDELSRLADDISREGGLTGGGAADLPIAGQIKVEEIFTEVSIPIIQGAPYAEELGISAGYRYSDYTTNGNGLNRSFDTDTWFAGISWALNDEVRLRVNQSVALRAPNVFELFDGINTGLVDLSSLENGLRDPCASDATTRPQASLEACMRSGVTADQYNNGISPSSAGQFNVITGGNPNLTPEAGETTTIGVVYTPRWIDGLSIAIDYFNIEVSNAIGTIPAQTSLSRCIEGAEGFEIFCSLINRDIIGALHGGIPTASGGDSGISQQNANIAALITSGFDINVNWAVDLDDWGLQDWGSLNFDYAGTLLDEYDTIPFAGAEKVKCRGFYADQCGLPAPEYQHRLLANWDTPIDGLGVRFTWRHVGETTNFTLDEAAAAQREERLDDYLEGRDYLDISANYILSDNFTLRAGANNILARDAPLSTDVGTGTGNNNTYPGLFDVSRYWFAGVTYRF